MSFKMGLKSAVPFSMGRNFGIFWGTRPLNSTGRHGISLNSTCDIRLSDMRHGGRMESDMRHGYFLNSTCDMVENKGQRHATLAFLKIDMRHGGPPPIKGPLSDPDLSHWESVSIIGKPAEDVGHL